MKTLMKCRKISNSKPNSSINQCKIIDIFWCGLA